MERPEILGRQLTMADITTSSLLSVGRFGLHPLFFEGLALGRVSGHYPPTPLRDSGVTGAIRILRAATRSALNTLFIVVHLNNPLLILTPHPLPCHGHLDDV